MFTFLSLIFETFMSVEKLPSDCSTKLFKNFLEQVRKLRCDGFPLSRFLQLTNPTQPAEKSYSLFPTHSLQIIAALALNLSSTYNHMFFCKPRLIVL